MRFGLVLGLLAILKKNFGANYEHFLRAFHAFRGKEMISFLKYCSVHTKKLHKMKVRKPKKNFKIYLKRLNITVNP